MFASHFFTNYSTTIKIRHFQAICIWTSEVIHFLIEQPAFRYVMYATIQVPVQFLTSKLNLLMTKLFGKIILKVSCLLLLLPPYPINRSRIYPYWGTMFNIFWPFFKLCFLLKLSQLQNILYKKWSRLSSSLFPMLN